MCNSSIIHPNITIVPDITFTVNNPGDINAPGLAGITITVNNNLNLNGASGDLLTLNPGSAWTLTVGGTANAQTVEAGFRIILKDPNVKAILINIFGGIVRCDRVAEGVIEAYRTIGKIDIPVIVRLQGTNAEEAKVLIDNSGLEVHSAITLQEAAGRVKELVH